MYVLIFCPPIFCPFFPLAFERFLFFFEANFAPWVQLCPLGPTSPLGANFTLGGPTSPFGANFTLWGQNHLVALVINTYVFRTRDGPEIVISASWWSTTLSGRFLEVIDLSFV
jgi:hypothetical protein